jgi:hypothetical protein
MVWLLLLGLAIGYLWALTQCALLLRKYGKTVEEWREWLHKEGRDG